MHLLNTTGNINKYWEVVGALRYDYFSDGRISRLTPKVSARYQPIKKPKMFDSVMAWASVHQH